MKISFKIDYRAPWGQTICICGSTPELGEWNEKKALRLTCYNTSEWSAIIDLNNDTSFIEYYYLVKDGDAIVRKEWGSPRKINVINQKSYFINDLWHEVPAQKFLYTSAFSDSFFAHEANDKISVYKNTFILNINCPYVKTGQELVICGESDIFGNWNPADAPRLTPVNYKDWQFVIDTVKIKAPLQYKLAIFDKATGMVNHWEYGNNRTLYPPMTNISGETAIIENIDYRYGLINWKSAGVSIPVFSLRSNDSSGIGEFSDLRKMVDWAVKTGQKVIQVLPINDTTITYTWADSYPYNAISTYALHPIYLGLKDFSLKDTKKQNEYDKKFQQLNSLPVLDYDKVITTKWEFFKDLYNEIGSLILKKKTFKDFFETNKEWLFPYACFSYLRDKYKSADASRWEGWEKYDKPALEKAILSDGIMRKEVELYYFIQYLLHMQLSEIKDYANKNGVVLKGDIPIGISRNSVEAWIEPHLFNLDTQTGAPPDDFSVNGQNWGFPTYNWDEMSKDNYSWWTKRFRKMADYFDAYRIDHILGFFRIWEIPLDSVQGLLGHFSPALPFTVEEIRNGGMWFDDYRMSNPYIHEHFLTQFFGEFVQEVIENYLQPISWQRFELKEMCNTQIKIKKLFEGKTDVKSTRIRNGLYGLCNEVLFVRDKKEPHKFHPRITAQYTYSYRDLDEEAKNAFNRLYDDFFYHRHSQFWKEQALNKLPTLISATRMLVCGEDLGMIPSSVPEVMQQLQILSLEIQRMPKNSGTLFGDLNMIPYLSVCTTSTHDMSPIRQWWHEDRNVTQRYYNDILWKQGLAPEDCTPELCRQILDLHLKSPAMLAILPLQDWLSIDGKIRNPHPENERINIPADPYHYWRYRMHITIEELLDSEPINEQIRSMLKTTGR